MRFWRNMETMKESTFLVLKRGIQLSALLLAVGCAAIWRGDLIKADSFRNLSQSVLLLAIFFSCYIESKE